MELGSSARRPWTLQLPLVSSFALISAAWREPTSGLEPLTSAPTTSLLAYILARTGASGNCAYLGGFRRSGEVVLSIVYQCVSARLLYVRRPRYRVVQNGLEE